MLAHKYYTACPKHEMMPDWNQRVREMYAGTRERVILPVPLESCPDCQRATREAVLRAIGGMRNIKPAYRGKWRYESKAQRVGYGNELVSWQARLREWIAGVNDWQRADVAA